MKKYISISLSFVALIAIVLLITSHFEYEGLETIVFSIFAVAIGYWLGKWTCHFHQKQKGFWLTVLVFTFLNLLHSMIDGASVGGNSSFISGVAVLSHEFARQPALYVVLWGMLTPFVINKISRIFIVPFIVTGVWFIGAYLGYSFFLEISQTSWLESIADFGGFLFLGDIIHHIIEQYRKLTNTTACCHTE